MLSFEDFRKQYGELPSPKGRGLLAKRVKKQDKKRKEKLLALKPKKQSKHIDTEKAFVQAVRDRDGDCVLTDRLDVDAYRLIKNNDTFKQGILDVAHIISRARAPHMKHDPDNAVLLNRLFHERIDGYKNPLTGDDMNEEQREKWLQILVGPERWKRLQDKFRKENA